MWRKIVTFALIIIIVLDKRTTTMIRTNRLPIDRFMIIAMPFVTFILHVLTCGVFAWFIGLFFGNGILGMLSAMGIEGFSMWQIGIFMGFFSGFFRRIITFNGSL